MARILGPKCRLCRAEGVKLFLRGERCSKEKCAINRREMTPGVAGGGRRFKKRSQYSEQQREKQKVKRCYGLLERQFRRYFQLAAASQGVTGEVLLSLLERRLDNVCFRLGFAVSRAAARQLVLHGYVTVNGRKVDVPSFLVKGNDALAVAAKGHNLKPVKEALGLRRQKGIVSWVTLDPDKPAGRVVRLPARGDIDLEIKESLIVELYSK